jgi:hypothetical protein
MRMERGNYPSEFEAIRTVATKAVRAKCHHYA